MDKRFLYTTAALTLFFIYLLLWLTIHFVVQTTEGPLNDLYADTYGILAGLGGAIGMYISSKWGMLKSYVGKSIFLFSLGLFSQFLGQLSYSIIYYVYHIENAYPSIGEIFYLASIPLYVAGLWYIAKASGFTLSSKSYKNKLSAIIIPGIMIGVSYYMFLHTYSADGLPLAIALLDHIYPLGQALFVSFAIVTFYGTRNVLGGVMRDRVLFILFSLVFQYIADTLFIYETRSELWYAGGLSDLMFLISYLLMTIGLIQFETGFINKAAKNYKQK